MNTLIMALFLILAAFILFSAVMVVSVKNIIHAALWLVASFFAVGALYFLMEAEFLGVAQVLVYAGAIAILILFAIMLTRDTSGADDRQLHRRWWLALVVSGALFGLIMVPTAMTTGWRTGPPPSPGQPPAIGPAAGVAPASCARNARPSGARSILLLVALVGAIVIAFERRERRRRVLTLAEQVRLRRLQEGAARPEVPAAPANVPTAEEG
nr:MAG: NADH-quinone oxidoreductase subunit J [Chloroflexota bacterium]